MVRQGDTSVQLVYAENKMPFLEHTAANGQVYVEVEPDSEYFIRVESHRPEQVVIKMKVDGENLGYRDTLSSNCGPRYEGLWSFDGHRDVMKAIVFVKTPVRQQGNNQHFPPYWTGEIAVDVYEAIHSGVHQRQAHSNAWKGGDVAYMMGAMDSTKKKGLKSSKGEFEQVRSTGGSSLAQMYREGRKLDTIVLKYCSTVGLIHAGILPKPPAWDFHRMQFPATNPAPPVPTDDNGNVDLTEE